MAEVVRKEPPVLIENVSLVINVFNIGHHGEVNNFSSSVIGGGQQPSRGIVTPLLQQNGLIQSSTSTSSSSSVTSSSISRSTEASCCSTLQNKLNGPDQQQNNLREQFPLGWIAFLNGDVIPFGVKPIALEIPSLGDKKSWKEIRVCLPPSLFQDNETDLYCPVSTCREKLPRNKSIDTHIKKHLGITVKESQMPVKTSNSEGSLPCRLNYYCHDKKCQYYVETAEKKSFRAYKNVKQHYQKVHAPRLFECDQCQKTFSTQKVLENHKLMCGEKYSCSSCEVSYNTLESLQTHCRRKNHSYDHIKYKDKRNSVKQEMQQKCNASTSTTPVPPPIPQAPSTTGRKPSSSKSTRKLPTILPKAATPTPAPPGVFNTIQAFCQQAGVKVDLGCQTVCTAFIKKSSPVEASVISSTTTPTFTQKKRKSTDTQTNIVKFRATCLDQRHNATNTNQDWKKVITSDSQTQTADSCDTMELSSKPATCSTSTSDSSSVQFNDEFATFKISETTTTSGKTKDSGNDAANLDDDAAMTPPDLISSVKDEQMVFTPSPPPPEPDDDKTTLSSIKAESTSSSKTCSTSTSTAIKVDNGPSLFSEFISFLEATDSATQTDPEMFDALGNGECFGIRGLFGDDLTAGEEDAYYVSVSSTASQTAVESISTKSLSAEDYESLLNTTNDKKIIDLNAFSEYIKSVEGVSQVEMEGGGGGAGGSGSGQNQQGTNDFLYDWEHIVEEVYRDVGD